MSPSPFLHRSSYGLAMEQRLFNNTYGFIYLRYLPSFAFLVSLCDPIAGHPVSLPLYLYYFNIHTFMTIITILIRGRQSKKAVWSKNKADFYIREIMQREWEWDLHTGTITTPKFRPHLVRLKLAVTDSPWADQRPTIKKFIQLWQLARDENFCY